MVPELHTGNEIDLLFEHGTGLQAVEIRSGATFVPEWLKGLKRWRALAGAQALTPWLVYGGVEGYRREDVEVIPWQRAGRPAD